MGDDLFIDFFRKGLATEAGHGPIGELFKFLHLIIRWGDEFDPLLCHRFDCILIFIPRHCLERVKVGLEGFKNGILKRRRNLFKTLPFFTKTPPAR